MHPSEFKDATQPILDGLQVGRRKLSGGAGETRLVDRAGLILDIYRKYYGLKMSVFLLATFYASMSLAALAIEFLFQAVESIITDIATITQLV